ncbi:MAG: hypothetical protein WEA56_08810 [Balneolaceae bacterium]
MMIPNLKPAQGTGETGPFISGEETYPTDFSQKFRDVIQKLVNLNEEGEEPGMLNEESTMNTEETGAGKNTEPDSSAGYRASAIFPDDAENFYTVIKFIGEDEAVTYSSIENEETSAQEQVEDAEEAGNFIAQNLTEVEQDELNETEIITADSEQKEDPVNIPETPVEDEKYSEQQVKPISPDAPEETIHNSSHPLTAAPSGEEQPVLNENQKVSGDYKTKVKAGFAPVQKNTSPDNSGTQPSGETATSQQIINGIGKGDTSFVVHNFSEANPESQQPVQLVSEEQNPDIIQKAGGGGLKTAGNIVPAGDLEFQLPKKKPEYEEKISLNMLSKSGNESGDKESSELFRRESAVQAVSLSANETGAAEEPEKPFEFTLPKKSKVNENPGMKEIQQVKDPVSAKTEMPSSIQVSNNKNFVGKILHAVRENLQSTHQTENGWKPHQFVFDDGSKVQFGVRQMEGVIQLKLGSSNSELNRLIQQHAGEIREHLESEMDVNVDLQFESGESENYFPKEAKGGNLSGPGKISGTEVGKTAEPEPVISRSFGFNNNEWTA